GRAGWIEAGAVVSGGTRRSSSASTRRCCRPRYSRRSMRSGFIVAEGFRDHFAVLAGQHLHACFSLFELLSTGFAQDDTTLEQLDRALEGQIAPFQFLDDLLQLLEAGLE